MLKDTIETAEEFKEVLNLIVSEKRFDLLNMELFEMSKGKCDYEFVLIQGPNKYKDEKYAIYSMVEFLVFALEGSRLAVHPVKSRTGKPDLMMFLTEEEINFYNKVYEEYAAEMRLLGE